MLKHPSHNQINIENALALAALQARSLMGLPLHKNRLAAWAVSLEKTRKKAKRALKNAWQKLTLKAHLKGPRLRVLVHIRGGIGDVAMARPFIKKLRAALPLAEIRFCYDNKATVDMVFSDGMIDGYQPRGYRAQDYDLVISGCHALVYDYHDRPRIEQLAPSFIPILEQGLRMKPLFQIYADHAPHLDGYLANVTVPLGYARVSNQGLATGLCVEQDEQSPIALDEKEFSVLEDWGLSNKKYITIHDGINTNTDTSSGFLSRGWPLRHWQEFVRLFKERFPDVLVVQLGGPKSRIFDFADVSLVGKTAVRHLPYVLDRALLHVDGESGMTHTAHLTSTTSLVLYGPSPMAYLAYKRNININASSCNNCMCIYSDWMTRCALNYPADKTCMASMLPSVVFEKASAFLLSQPQGVAK